MKNVSSWYPSKFEYRKSRLKASKNRKEVSISSILMVNLIAKFYDANIKSHVKGKLLDLGCGKVPLFAAYKNYAKEIICVDWENSLHQNEFVDFEMDLNKKLLFSDNEFDTIILSDVLEHIANPELLWTEMYRILKPQGKLILNVPFLYWIHAQPFDYFRYTRFTLKAVGEKAGFKILKLEEIGGYLEVMTDLFAKGIKHVPLFGKFLSLIAQQITFVFFSTKFGEQISKKTSQNFPLGYFLIALKE